MGSSAVEGKVPARLYRDLADQRKVPASLSLISKKVKKIPALLYLEKGHPHYSRPFCDFRPVPSAASNLKELPPSIGQLNALQELHFQRCYGLGHRSQTTEGPVLRPFSSYTKLSHPCRLYEPFCSQRCLSFLPTVSEWGLFLCIFWRGFACCYLKWVSELALSCTNFFSVIGGYVTQHIFSSAVCGVFRKMELAGVLCTFFAALPL